MKRSLLACFLLFFIPLPAIEWLSPIAIYLTWESDPCTTMSVRWITEELQIGRGLSYQVDRPNAPVLTAPVATCRFPEDHHYYLHAAQLTDLTPGTTYRFTLDGLGHDHRFSTMPSSLSAPLTFVIGGDVNLSDVRLFDETSQQVARQHPAFVAIGGDLACAASKNPTKSEHCSQWITWFSHWYTMMQTENGTIIPVLATAGNHDVKGAFGQTPEQAPFFTLFFPTPMKKGYAVLRFDTYLSLYLLDSGHMSSPYGEQARWLAHELSHDEKMLHRLAVYHVPAYPAARSYRSNCSTAIRQNFVPIFDTFHLHMAFENHDHIYKRTYPMTAHHVDPHGVVYIGNGPWGTIPRSPKNLSSRNYLETWRSVRQVCLVTLTPTQRSVQALTYDGLIIDQYSQPVQ
jgi:hypothetical protein